MENYRVQMDCGFALGGVWALRSVWVGTVYICYPPCGAFCKAFLRKHCVLPGNTANGRYD